MTERPTTPRWLPFEIGRVYDCGVEVLEIVHLAATTEDTLYRARKYCLNGPNCVSGGHYDYTTSHKLIRNMIARPRLQCRKCARMDKDPVTGRKRTRLKSGAPMARVSHGRYSGKHRTTLAERRWVQAYWAVPPSILSDPPDPAVWGKGQ